MRKLNDEKIVEEIRNSWWVINNHLTNEDLDEFILYVLKAGRKQFVERIFKKFDEYLH